jgi:hypothetical protein
LLLAVLSSGAYIGGMNSKTIILIVALVVMLGAAMTFSWHVWTSVGADASNSGGEAMNGNGVAALIIGGIGTLVVGGGLMALVFFSSRRGYDDAADFKHLDE